MLRFYRDGAVKQALKFAQTRYSLWLITSEPFPNLADANKEAKGVIFEVIHQMKQLGSEFPDGAYLLPIHRMTIA